MDKREIKFRMWDGADMYYPNDGQYVAFFSEPKQVAWRLYSKHSTEITDSQYGGEIMQFTGLHDKNGKEIYEGDVLATSNDGKDGCDVWPEEICGVVKWDTGGHGWMDLPDNDPISMYGPQYVYIIGNVHQNPELLKP